LYRVPNGSWSERMGTVDYDALRFALQALTEATEVLEVNGLGLLAEAVEDIADRVADEIDKEDLAEKEEVEV